MNTQELIELRRLANAVDEANRSGVFDRYSKAMDDFRSASYPAKVIELVDTIQTLQAQVQQWKSEAMTGSNAQMLRDQNKVLQAEVDARKADTDRLDWLEASDGSHGFCHTMYGEYRFYAHQLPNYPTVRQVIDAAKGNV